MGPAQEGAPAQRFHQRFEGGVGEISSGTQGDDECHRRRRFNGRCLLNPRRRRRVVPSEPRITSVLIGFVESTAFAQVRRGQTLDALGGERRRYLGDQCFAVEVRARGTRALVLDEVVAEQPIAHDQGLVHGARGTLRAAGRARVRCHRQPRRGRTRVAPAHARRHRRIRLRAPGHG